MAWPAGPILLPGGKGLLDATGKFIVNAEDCCCVEIGEDCTHCDAGTTPANMTVVFSGWSIDCSCDLSGVLYYTVTWTGDIDGSHVLAQTADPCVWTKTVAVSSGDFVLLSYTDSGCTTPTGFSPEDLPAGNIIYTLTKTANDWTLNVRYDTGDDTYVFTLFDRTIADTGSDVCTSPTTPITNTTGDCSISILALSFGKISTLGTATVTAGP